MWFVVVFELSKLVLVKKSLIGFEFFIVSVCMNLCW